MRRNLTIISVDLARTSTIHRTLESHSGLAISHLTRSLPLQFRQWEVWSLARGEKQLPRSMRSNGKLLHMMR